VNLISYEVWYNDDNQQILEDFSAALDFEPGAVPVTIIGDCYWIGFREEYKSEMDAALQAALNDPNPVDVGAALAAAPETQASAPSGKHAAAEEIITLPLIGQIDLARQSLAFSTAVIGFVDGFNPCSLWVLSVLLALTLHSGSRKKILAVGLTFLLVTTIVYSLFITGVFTLLSYVGYLKWIQIAVALMALVFGLVNLKDYFWYKEGLSFTISDKHKPKLYKDMRSTVTDTRSMLGLISSSAALAVGVSFIEFSCTAGFPVIWSNLIAANDVGVWQFMLLLGLYMFIYLLDELAVFSSVAVTMRASRVEEKHGRLLKLISGALMLTLSIVMLINPQWMNGIGSSLLVFLAALLITALIYLIHRKLLPRFGILIGSELQSVKTRKHPKRS
jgi:Thiol:disulfide interchange protein